jgi:hypothetical protein
MATETNQREFTRVPITLEVRLTVGGSPIEGGHVRDLSLKGMLVLTDRRFPVGTPCEALLTLVEGQVEIRTSGVVAAENPRGFGVEFTTIDGLDSYIHLRNLVLYNTQDVEKVEEEFRTHTGLHRRDEL